MIVEFTVPGVPIGKGRPRIGRVGGNARMFTPAKTANYEGLIAHCAHVAMAGRPLIECPATVLLYIHCPIPASWSKKKQQSAVNGDIYPTTKPDMDNVVKAIFDGMNGVVWKDDVQAVSLTVVKHYSDTPCVIVKVGDMA